MINSFINLFRTSHWWNYIFPPILGILYFVLLNEESKFEDIWLQLILFFISFVFTASFGFFYNDFCDIESDNKAGKQNFVQKFSLKKRYFVLFLLLFLAILPWLFFKNIQIGIFLFSIQLFLLFAYSHPYIRLKNKIHIAIITDALYSSLLPALIAFFLFSKNNLKTENIEIILFFISILFLRGLRNILIHQIIDAENDIKSNTQTIVISYGEHNIYKTLSFILLPIEIIMIVLFCVFLVLKIDFAWIIIPLLIIFYAVKLFDAKAEKNKILKIQIINDFYEDIFPIFILTLLSFIDYYYLILLFVHVIVFKNKVVWLLLPWLYYKLFHNKYIKKGCYILGIKTKVK